MPKLKTSTQWSSFQVLASTVLPARASGTLASRFRHWEEHKGTQWLVSRLKALNTAAKLHIAGRPDEAKLLLMDESIKTSSAGIPSGAEGMLLMRAISSNPRTSRKAFAILRSYTGFFLPEPTSRQLEKSRTSINSPYTGYKPDAVTVGQWSTKMGLRPFYRTRQRLTLKPVTDLRGTSSYPSEVNLANRDMRLPYESLVASLMSRGFVPQSLIKYYGQDFALRQVAQGNQSLTGSSTLGKIVVLQEGGAKGRVICSPNAWIQFYMKPLHDRLYHIIQVEEDASTPLYYGVSCVTDQLRGVYHASRVQEEGGFIASVDLSSATDRFPLWFQQALLRACKLGEFGEIFEDLKGPYDSPEGDTWSYETGQPMGVYGSFPLFHLSHLALLRWACIQLNLSRDTVNFAVLGDDVLIFNQDLHKIYRGILDDLGVEISHQKSFVGQHVDFAGFTIEPGRTPYRPYKWARDLNFGPVIHTLSTFAGSCGKISPWWTSALDKLSKTMGQRDLSLSPLVPANEPVPGIKEEPTVDYLMSLTSKLESRSKVSHIHSLVPPVLFNRIEDEWYRLTQSEAGSFGIDPLTWKDPQREWSDFEIFSRDPLIRNL